MGNNKPDFSGAFEMASSDLVNDELEEARKRLLQKHKTKQSKSNSQKQLVESGVQKKSLEIKSKNPPVETTENLVVKSLNSERKAFTLKVLATNESKFHQLFCQLQLKGDSRKKQDLADEALELLFVKYESFLAR